MDETSVALYNGLVKGNVLFSRRRPGGAPEPAQRIDKNKLRTNLTMISFCCSETALQAIMPHIIIGNENTFKASEFLDLLNNSPPNVYLIRQKSAWNNKKVMGRICDLLRIILQPYVDTYYFVFGIDAAGCHIVPETLLALRASFLHFLLIPAKLTFLLQVLDTHGFRRWKSAMRKEYQRKRTETESGQLTIAMFLEVLYTAISTVFTRIKWSRGFAENGWSHSQQHVSKFIKDWCGIDAMPAISSDMPSIEDLKPLFPGGNITYRYDLCAPVPSPVLPLLPPPAPVAPELPAPAAPVLVLPPPPSSPPAQSHAHEQPLFPRRRLPASFGAGAGSSVPLPSHPP